MLQGRRHLKIENQRTYAKYLYIWEVILWIDIFHFIILRILLCGFRLRVVIKGAFNLSVHNFTPVVLLSWKVFGFRLTGLICKGRHCSRFVFVCFAYKHILKYINMYIETHICTHTHTHISLKTAKYTSWFFLAFIYSLEAWSAFLRTQYKQSLAHSYLIMICSSCSCLLIYTYHMPVCRGSTFEVVFSKVNW